MKSGKVGKHETSEHHLYGREDLASSWEPSFSAGNSLAASIDKPLRDDYQGLFQTANNQTYKAKLQAKGSQKELRNSSEHRQKKGQPALKKGLHSSTKEFRQNKASEYSHNLFSNRMSFQNLMMMNTPFLTDHTRSMVFDKQQPNMIIDRLSLRRGSDVNIYNETGFLSNVDMVRQSARGKNVCATVLQSDKKHRTKATTRPVIHKTQKQKNFLKFLTPGQDTPRSNKNKIDQVDCEKSSDSKKDTDQTPNKEMVSPVNKSRRGQELIGMQPQDKDNFLTKSKQIVEFHKAKQNKAPALYKSLKNKFIALKYKTKVSVEGVGEYEVEVTNVVDTKTLKEKSYVPSLMSMANIQKAEAERYRRIMSNQVKKHQPAIPSAKVAMLSHREQGLSQLSRLVKRHLRKNFDRLQMNSIDYQRTLMIRREQHKVKQQRALDKLDLHLRIQANHAKTKAFYQWRESVNVNYTHSSGGNRTNMLLSFGLSTIERRKSNLSKVQKKVIRRMDEALLTHISAFFTQWKLKTLLLRGNKQAQKQVLTSISNSTTSKLEPCREHEAEDNIDLKLQKIISGLNGAVRVKRLPQQDEADNISDVSNTEVKGDSGEFDGQKFMDVTIGFENESGARLDLADSQLFMCDESDASDDEAEATNVLNELNDMIHNINKKQELGDIEDVSGKGSVDNDELYALDPMPKTSSMAEEEETGSIQRVENYSQVNISQFELTPFEVQQQAQESEALRARAMKVQVQTNDDEVGLAMISPTQGGQFSNFEERKV